MTSRFSLLSQCLHTQANGRRLYTTVYNNEWQVKSGTFSLQCSPFTSMALNGIFETNQIATNITSLFDADSLDMKE